MRQNIGLLIAPFVGALVLAEYIALFIAAAGTHTGSPACLPAAFAGAGRGWEAGVCLTEEQVWCRYHGNHRHINCLHADCRAEEIRLTLWARNNRNLRPPREPAYAGCPASSVERIWSHIDEMNGGSLVDWADRGACAVCVPAGDKRASYLPVCDAENATCRGLFFTPPRNYSGLQPLECPVFNASAAESVAERASRSCPSDVSDWPLSSWPYYP